MKSKKGSLGLYIHIPFCKAKCFYCDFNSFCGRDSHIPAYFDALEKELLQYSKELQDYSIKSIFIGGGTPSHVDSSYISSILNTSMEVLCVEKGAEVSIETNPGTLSKGKLAAYKHTGINRLSIGLQAWQNHLLKKLGRIHDTDEFVENFTQAKDEGFTNINVDLIFGLPGQMLAEWEYTLQNVVRMGPTHISCYSLKIEEGTVFGDRYERGELTPAEDELDRDMYQLAKEILGESNYKHYEISNFALPGYECRHNLVYWRAEQYIGLGAGAHSYINGERFNNIESIEEYIKAVNDKKIIRENIQPINKKDSMAEFMILGLRLTEGISPEDFKLRYGEDVFMLYGTQIHGLVKRELLELENGRMKLTSKGLDLANQVFVEFI